MEKIRFYSSNIGPIKENELKALKKAIQICFENNEIQEITALIHTKNNTGYLERIFETRDAKKIFNGIKIDPSVPIIKTETIKTINDDWNKKRVLIAFGLRSEELYLYDEFESVVAIIAHQWNENSVQEWAKTWGAVDILTNRTSEKYNQPDKVVQNALNDLTRSINMSTGITHPSDENLCKTYLRALNKYEYKLNPVEINSYLLSELNWQSDDVKDVVKLIDKLNSGGYFKGGDKTGLQNHIKRWKTEN
ncbi:hypothetical protein [Flavobacterium sp. HSC-61S13]|uniref:hypothetical protein n=1 Tax=Flavobacterium sp. HSC-61S13 TaxID=2910963 RepID=UPI0020A15B49|nr:hypothetical protein [Flavobacterium sp. HSC-61S13]MCP1994423.1 hypothetical protein [Flavobacterium sp. HSC-61S13]